MKKVIISSANLRSGNGIASCIMSYYDGLLNHGYQVDFALLSNVPSPHMEHIEKHGGKIFIYPHNTGKPNKENAQFIRNIFTKGNYDIVHNNLTGLNGVTFLRTAQKCGVRNRIHHSHNPRETSSMKARIRSSLYDPICAMLSTKGLACSSLAGDDVFGKNKYTVLPNAINPELYKFDHEYRQAFRTEYGLKDKFVIGTVCRHAEQKNPFFIVDGFKEVLKKNKDARLLWVGSGPLSENVQRYVDNNNLHDYVVMLGARKDVNKIYSAMDIFFLPSLFEGLGMVYIEAQASGLYCIASDVIPKDTAVTNNIEYISLKKKAEFWADRILAHQNYKDSRSNNLNCLKEQGYDIRYCGDQLAKIYDSL